MLLHTCHTQFFTRSAFQHMFCILLLPSHPPDIGAVNAWIGTKDTTTALSRSISEYWLKLPGLNIRLYSTSQTKMLYAEPALRVQMKILSCVALSAWRSNGDLIF